MTTSIITTSVAAFIISAGLGFILIPLLRKLNFGQTIKEIGPNWHKSKEGTPTMGGIMFIAAVIIASVLGFIISRSRPEAAFGNANALDDTYFVSGLVFAFAMGIIGFLDDYIKVVKKRNLGLSAKQKTLFQFIVIIGYMISIDNQTTVIDIPFIGSIDLWYFYYPLMAIAMYFMVNAVNLTDGIDGLAGSVTFVAAIGFLIISTVFSLAGMQIIAAALAAGCLGFLIWNFHPAKVFMGDTGSMFLGGLVVALAMGCRQPLLLLFVGIIYIIEALSVVIQVISFKLFGKRVFKMSPIHHHFEMCGWSEIKIVLVFTLVTVIFTLIAVLAAYNSIYAG